MFYKLVGFFKGMYFLYRVYGLKLSYFNKKIFIDCMIIISLIVLLVMLFFIIVRFEKDNRI